LWLVIFLLERFLNSTFGKGGAKISTFGKGF